MIGGTGAAKHATHRSTCIARATTRDSTSEQDNTNSNSVFIAGLLLLVVVVMVVEKEIERR